MPNGIVPNSADLVKMSVDRDINILTKRVEKLELKHKGTQNTVKHLVSAIATLAGYNVITFNEGNEK